MNKLTRQVSRHLRNIGVRYINITSADRQQQAEQELANPNVTLPLTHLSEDETVMKQTVSRLAQEQIAPHVREMEKDGRIKDSVLKMCFENGLFGIEIDPEYGGAGCNFMTTIVTIEELAKVDPAVSIPVDIQNTLINAVIVKLGTRDQKEMYLKRLARDTNIVAIRTILYDHRRILENIGTKEDRPTIITDFETVPKKPFSLMKLMKYEDILLTEEARKQLETAFFLIGGDANNSIRRGLGKLLSNKLAIKCSFYGRKGNYALKYLKCVTILREASRKRFGHSFSDKDFQNNISQWLKQASLRFIREQRKLELLSRTKGETRVTEYMFSSRLILPPI